ncbi:MAG: hypothetical protein KatS3mg109_0103 [Pirellulaceae bacterium]|nr:MAG: hypothetical protein KatS3mg109_0103 [Pirellulaceae bacterium]
MAKLTAVEKDGRSVRLPSLGSGRVAQMRLAFQVGGKEVVFGIKAAKFTSPDSPEIEIEVEGEGLVGSLFMREHDGRVEFFANDELSERLKSLRELGPEVSGDG